MKKIYSSHSGWYTRAAKTSCESCAGNNNKPSIAIAGPNQFISLPTDRILLDGSRSSDPNGSISKYQWGKLSGPSSSTLLKN
jgi:hypothetical protein